MKTCYLAPNATVVGDVVLEENVSIWYGAVVRGDEGRIVIGGGTNVQDNAVLHDALTIGRNCVIGHGAIVHGCTVGDGCLIGMGAIVLSGAQLGDGCIVAAGSVVTGKTRAPAGSMLMGSPARVVRPVTAEQQEDILRSAAHYVELAKRSLRP